MRIVIDYRAALKTRTGVGEYTHQLASALLSTGSAPDGSHLDLTLFSSSSKDRLLTQRDLPGAKVVDRRVPVSVLNFAWHRLGWPNVELLAGTQFDVAHSMHPLLMPTRSAAQVVTIHDLNFLLHPERTSAEIKRDYPVLVRQHANRADQVIVVSEFTAAEVGRLLDVPGDHISVCSPGAPPWARRHAESFDGYVLFFGTLEPRKNVGTLLDAWELLVSQRNDLPTLLLAGKATEQAAGWLERIARPPLKDRVKHVGYVAPDERPRLYEGARLLVQPSFEEGFGLPVLEAMTVGVPVIAANAGALPEVGEDAVLLVPPTDPREMADAIARLLDDRALASRCAERGVKRASHYSWERTAETTLDAYARAIARRVRRRGAA
ncbi:MAG: glycosyltransferase family 1 protein [Vicinamibacterales bacterium]